MERALRAHEAQIAYRAANIRPGGVPTPSSAAIPADADHEPRKQRPYRRLAAELGANRCHETTCPKEVRVSLSQRLKKRSTGARETTSCATASERGASTSSPAGYPGPTPPEPPPLPPPPIPGALLRRRPRRRPFRGRLLRGLLLLPAALLLRVLRARLRSPPSSTGAPASVPDGVGARGFFAAVLEAVAFRLAFEFFERGDGFGPGFFERCGVFAFGREFEFALDLRELFCRGDELGVARFFLRRSQALETVDHADVEVGDLGGLVRASGARDRADRGVDLGADRVALRDQLGFAQRRGRFGRGRRFGRSSSPPPQPARASAASGIAIQILEGLIEIAAAQGLEPRLPLPERGVLPLHQAAMATPQNKET